jgi:hypothetical protein
MPADRLAERAADQRRQERADIDADIEDRIGAVAAVIAGRIKAADLGRDVRLEAAVAENEREQREQEQLLDAIMKWPIAISMAPITTVRRWPSTRSAMSPPRIGVK